MKTHPFKFFLGKGSTFLSPIKLTISLGSPGEDMFVVPVQAKIYEDSSQGYYRPSSSFKNFAVCDFL